MTAALFSIDAVNLAEHSDNPVHTEQGGIAAGFGGAIVAGTTVYAYLVRAAVELHGSGWISSGGGTLRLRAPVLAGEAVQVRMLGDRLAACVGDRECARLVHRTPARAGGEVAEGEHPAGRPAGSRHPSGGPSGNRHPVGGPTGGAFEPLARRAAGPAGSVGGPTGGAFEPLRVELTEELTGYSRRCGDDDPRYDELGVVHPVVWLVLANRVFAHNLVRGPWVHTRSEISHSGRVEPGDTVVVEGAEIDRFVKPTGERAVVAMRFAVADEIVAVVEHEAII